MKLAEALPSVKELHLGWTILSAENLITFINKCPLLKNIQCRIIDSIAYKRLKDMMGAESMAIYD